MCLLLCHFVDECDAPWVELDIGEEEIAMVAEYVAHYQSTMNKQEFKDALDIVLEAEVQVKIL